MREAYSKLTISQCRPSGVFISIQQATINKTYKLEPDLSVLIHVPYTLDDF